MCSKLALHNLIRPMESSARAIRFVKIHGKYHRPRQASVSNQDLRIDRTTKSLVTQGVPKVISETDKNAIEEAVRIKEKHGGKVTAITMGSPDAKDALREALAMGADEAYLLTDPLFEGSDSHAIANVLAAAVTKILDYDLILCGTYSEDFFSFQVGPRLAEICNLPQVTYATKINVEGTKVVVERDLENERQVVEGKFPCLISVVRELNEPRLPTLMAIMAVVQEAYDYVDRSRSQSW